VKLKSTKVALQRRRQALGQALEKVRRRQEVKDILGSAWERSPLVIWLRVRSSLFNSRVSQCMMVEVWGLAGRIVYSGGAPYL